MTGIFKVPVTLIGVVNLCGASLWNFRAFEIIRMIIYNSRIIRLNSSSSLSSSDIKSQFFSISNPPSRRATSWAASGSRKIASAIIEAIELLSSGFWTFSLPTKRYKVRGLSICSRAFIASICLLEWLICLCKYSRWNSVCCNCLTNLKFLWRMPEAIALIFFWELGESQSKRRGSVK